LGQVRRRWDILVTFTPWTRTQYRLVQVGLAARGAYDLGTCLANISRADRPIPVLAPVITTTFPSSRPVSALPPHGGPVAQARYLTQARPARIRRLICWKGFRRPAETGSVSHVTHKSHRFEA